MAWANSFARAAFASITGAADFSSGLDDRDVYGGLLASIIDCHSTGTASAAAFRKEGREMDTEPSLRFVTASLHVEYIHPTPLDTTLEIRGNVEEIKGRKVVVNTTVTANGRTCVKGRVVAVKMPENLIIET